MKITKTNIIDKWSEIEKYLPKQIKDFYEEADPADWTDDDMADLIDPFIDKVNEVLEKKMPTEKKTRKGKYTTAKGKYKITSRRKKGEPKAKKEEEKPAKKPKTTGSNAKKSSSTPKKGAKAGKKTDEAPKTEKQGKPKVGEAAPWQSTLRKFASMCGKERTVTSIRKFVREIQANFSAKLKGKTPHIELIREIQEKLLPKANSSERKVTLPQWDDLKKQCQAAAREWTVSKTVKKPEIKSTSLSGVKKKRKTKKTRK